MSRGFRMLVVFVTALAIVALVTVQKASADPGPGYVIQEGDTLEGIAERFGLRTDQAHLVYLANDVAIDKAAQAYGRQNSNNGEILIPGTVLVVVGASSDAQPDDPALVGPIVVHEGVSAELFAGTTIGLSVLLVVVIGAVLGYFVYLSRSATRRPTTD